MAGGHMKYRTLGRKSSHRQALLRNLVSSLIRHESIQTSWHKAKEAQRLADKLITLGKKGTEAAKNRVKGIFFEEKGPQLLRERLFTTLADRYATRPGGYTRVLRIEPIKEDQSPSAILELVDGPRDMRFALTAKTLARARDAGKAMNEVTRGNIEKVTRYRSDGRERLEEMVERMRNLNTLEERRKVHEDEGLDFDEVLEEEGPNEEDEDDYDEGMARRPKPKYGVLPKKKRVYPEQDRSR